MNVRTDRQRDTDRQTDRIHILHVYVGLAQASPNKRIGGSNVLGKINYQPFLYTVH